jgi:hypothetical protein
MVFNATWTFPPKLGGTDLYDKKVTLIINDNGLNKVIFGL